MKKLDPNHCPVCSSSLIRGDSFDVYVNEAVQEMFCEECGSTWNDVYSLIAQRDVVPGAGTDEEA